jgi:DNA-directed RNA polymerase specialized sigma subunit
MESDLSLINKIKDSNDSECLVELIDRHSGVYQYVIDKFTKSPSSIIDRSAFMDDKLFVIYESAIEFDPTRNSKFSTFLANRARWKCLNAINKKKKLNPISIDTPLSNGNGTTVSILKHSDPVSSPSDYVSDFEVFDIFYKMLDEENDDRVKKIIDIRYNSGDNKLEPWRKAAELLDLSIQGVINIHNKFIKKVNKEINKNYV